MTDNMIRWHPKQRKFFSSFSPWLFLEWKLGSLSAVDLFSLWHLLFPLWDSFVVWKTKGPWHQKTKKNARRFVVGDSKTPGESAIADDRQTADMWLKVYLVNKIVDDLGKEHGHQNSHHDKEDGAHSKDSWKQQQKFGLIKHLESS